MGHFIQLGGVLESEDNIKKAIEELKGSHEIFDSVGYYSENKEKTLLFLDDYDGGAEEAIQELSKKLNTSSFYFHIHDGDLWMYTFFVKGEELDRFNTRPSYWEKISEEEIKSWSGKAEIIEANWTDTKKADIERYLVLHNEDSDGLQKAYPDDEFESWDIWQLTDFLAKLGMPYPDEDEEE